MPESAEQLRRAPHHGRAHRSGKPPHMTETLCITPCECECGNENVPRCCIAGGMTLWVVDYTVTEHGRESSFVTVHAAECAARQLVANLLRDRQLGTEVSDVYSERT